MAVPKKRTSKSKCRSRKAKWKSKAYDAYKKSLSLGKSVITGRSKSFIYVQQGKEEE
uniref:Large ribosomal subunit protein bL32c n=1 Tax=Gracilaria vermiculophylla TaxID=2608709 RepID=A0A345U8Q6_9FLOR|nr:ribosomal protein L32 [Gracilaria vermiculophylla]AXI96842.1 ribosomal protein L32 [Gracilaria vermiculophylla]QXU75056.1 ribosomal protein L32 [Gracilaria vermiculophylla]WDZ68056.1 ribosomal protein L32 [Gracilaria vermiculophylla]